MTRPWRCFAILILWVGILSGQAPLTVVTASLPQGTVGVLYSTALAANGGIFPYTWSIANGSLPPGLALNSVGNIIGTPTTVGAYTITFRVTDASQSVALRSLTIFVAAPVQFSITTTSPLPTATQGQSYSLSLAATNGTLPYQWIAQGLPAGLTLSPSGVISGIPTTLGIFNFSVQVTDAVQRIAVAIFSITVNPPPLSIITVPPLFSGIVGTPYAQSFSASGGRPPYTWSILSGSIPGLSLDSTSGTLQGTPQNAGTFNITIQVTDSAGSRVSQSFAVVVNQPSLSLIVSGQLPPGAVGAAYSQKIPATVGGGTPPYTWSVIGGLVPGLNFDATNVVLSGTPTTSGTFSLTIQVSDSAGLTASRPFSVTIAPAALNITTVRQLPDATFNVPLSQQFAASGGVPPYTWSTNGLPTGLGIDANSGLLSGTPVAAGSFSFAVTVQDTTLKNYSDRFTINVTLPPTPSVTISGLPATVTPAQQYPLQIVLAAPFPVDIAGVAILSFSPDSGPVDRTIQFASGGTTATFTFLAGSTTPKFPNNTQMAVQTGTVSGTITVSLRLQAGVTDITPTPSPATTAQIAPAAPVINSVQVSRSGNSISFAATGFSTAREVTQAVFSFAAASGQTLQPGASSITVSVESLFGNWFQDPANAAYGSQFVFTQTFLIQGDASAVIPQSVTLANRLGSTNANINP